MDRPGRTDEVTSFERRLIEEPEPLAGVWSRHTAGSYFDRFRYCDTIVRDGLEVVMESEHRPVGCYTEAIADAGFLVERLREVRVPDHAVSTPRNRRWQRLPPFLHIRALRP